MNRIVAFTRATVLAVVGGSLTTEETQAAHGHGCGGRHGWNYPVARGVYRVLGFERRQSRRAARQERRHARHAAHGCSGEHHGCSAPADCSGGHAEPAPAVSVAPVCPNCTAAKPSDCPGGVCPRPNS